MAHPASIPEHLLESEVVVVPTLRPTSAGPVAGGLRTLARLLDTGDPAQTVSATTTVDPAVSVLDATVAFGGQPYAADALFAGELRAVDAVAASLLDRSIEDDDVLSAAFEGDRGEIHVDGVDVAALRTRLPTGALPPSGRTHPAVSQAYRLYATVSGDAVPPQFAGNR